MQHCYICNINILYFRVPAENPVLPEELVRRGTRLALQLVWIFNALNATAFEACTEAELVSLSCLCSSTLKYLWLERKTFLHFVLQEGITRAILKYSTQNSPDGVLDVSLNLPTKQLIIPLFSEYALLYIHGCPSARYFRNRRRLPKFLNRSSVQARSTPIISDFWLQA